MGVSTDAILVYGVPLADEDAIERYDEECTPVRPMVGPSWMVFNGSSEDGISIVSHCSDRCTMYIVAIAGTKITAWRGNPVRIEDLRCDPAWGNKLTAFLEKYSLVGKTDGAPGWWLASWWG